MCVCACAGGWVGGNLKHPSYVVVVATRSDQLEAQNAVLGGDLPERFLRKLWHVYKF